MPRLPKTASAFVSEVEASRLNIVCLGAISEDAEDNTLNDDSLGTDLG